MTTFVDNESVTFGLNSTDDDLEKTLVLAAADANARQEKYKETTTSDDESNNPSTSNSNFNDDNKIKTDSNSESVQLFKEYSRNDITCDSTASENFEAAECRGVRRAREYNENVPTKFKRVNETSVPKVQEGYSNLVATHYNSLEEKGLNERSKSRIFYMRNFHNWIKSMLINEYLSEIKEKQRHNSPIQVHDMCCGKGGDLLKWKKGNISHLICSDIAEVSLDQCKVRYEDMKRRAGRERNFNVYSVEYISADCSRVR